MKIQFLSLAFHLVTVVRFGQGKKGPIVHLEDGSLEGLVGISRGRREHYIFEGVQYGVVNGRFKLPEPVKPWEGVKKATKVGTICPQNIGGGLLDAASGASGGEECLFLNVYTHNLAPDELVPVMVWIHGGIFTYGAGSDYSGKYVMDEDAVLVTINYRLGVLGFLYTEDDTIPGNLGMRDQVEALKWVQRHIQKFGGNPNLVTIWGESAGGASVHHLLLSPMATGLFHRAIAQSGTAIAPWSVAMHPKWQAQNFSARLGCPTEPSSALVECVRQVDLEKLIETQNLLSWPMSFFYSWAPVIEVDKQNGREAQAFLAAHPSKLLKEQKVPNRVPFIAGVVKNEGALFAAFKMIQEMNALDEDLYQELTSNWTSLAPGLFLYSLLDRKELTPRVTSAAHRIRDFYFNFGKLSISLATEQRLTDALSDSYFVHSAQVTARMHSEMMPTYAYLFTYDGGFSFPHMADYYHHDPPTHFDDVFYFFPYMFRTSMDTKEELDFSKKIIKLWVSFAKTGRPEATWGIGGTPWPQVSHNDTPFSWYKLDQSPQLLRSPFVERMRFWDELRQTDLKGDTEF